jgi:methionine-rich copper-binding protein CopC
MKRLLISLAAASLPLLMAAPAIAHTSVREMSIADNARLASAPENFTIVFSGPVGLANVTLTNTAGQNVPLTYTPSREMAASHTMPLPALQPGAYILSWRMIAHDGHAMPGAVHFTLTGG